MVGNYYFWRWIEFLLVGTCGSAKNFCWALCLIFSSCFKLKKKGKFLHEKILESSFIFVTFQSLTAGKKNAEIRFKVKVFSAPSSSAMKGGWKISNRREPQAGVCVNNEISFGIYGVWQHKTYFLSSSFLIVLSTPESLWWKIFIDFTQSCRQCSRNFFSFFLRFTERSQKCLFSSPNPFFIPLKYRFFFLASTVPSFFIILQFPIETHINLLFEWNTEQIERKEKS